MRRCSGCEDWKPLDGFGEKRSHGRAIPMRRCKDCERTRRREKARRRSPEQRQRERARHRARQGKAYRTKAEIQARAIEREAAKAARSQRRAPTLDEVRARDRAYQRERRRSREGAARRAVQHAVEQGLIRKPDNCELCGKLTPRHVLHGHHEDYDRQLEVTWLCAACHAAIDGRYARRAS